MVSIRDGLITQILPQNIGAQDETKALAYALRKQMRWLLDKADGIMLLCDVDNMPDEILDYLAADWRTPMYSDKLPIETKRELVKNTLFFFYQMGMPAAVNKMIQTVFLGGQMEEFYEYGGEPHYFTAEITTSEEIDADVRSDLKKAVNSVKRLSSWLESISISAEPTSSSLTLGSAAGSHMETKLSGYTREWPTIHTCTGFAAGSIMTTRLRAPDAETA